VIDGEFLASREWTATFWEVGTWKEQTPLVAYAPLGLAFSPDGRTLATASVEGIRLFELATHRERAHTRPRGYPGGGILQFSITGRWLAWQSDGTTIHVWDVHGGNLLGPITGHDDSVTGLAFTADERALVSSSNDSTILIWDIAACAAHLPRVKVGDLDQAWQALTNDDAKAAYDAMRALAASPTAAVKRMIKELKPAAPLDAKRIAAFLRDLDSEKFEVRERATRGLEQLGDPVAATLKRFLTGNPSLEASRRVAGVLAKVTGMVRDPEQLRQLRALELLERVGDDEAQRVLEAIAKGAPEARLTREARTSLERLSRRTAVGP